VRVAALLLVWPALMQAQNIAIGQYALPTARSCPEGIATGPDGALWFTEEAGQKIGRISPAGAITEYPLPPPSGDPIPITAGPDGALWFADDTDIGSITTSGVISEYGAGTTALGIAEGSDGDLWFTEYYGSSIARMTTDGAVTRYELPTNDAFPVWITAGPDGALWFTESQVNQIGRITTAREPSPNTLCRRPIVCRIRSRRDPTARSGLRSSSARSGESPLRVLLRSTSYPLPIADRKESPGARTARSGLPREFQARSAV
jgi:streptogramin lyase